MKRCEECKKLVPEVELMSGEDMALFVCGICALRIRNEAHGFPLATPFTGKRAQAMFCRAVHFLGDDAPEWAKKVANGDRGIEGFQVIDGNPAIIVQHPEGEAN